jgi:hypothetical protein
MESWHSLDLSSPHPLADVGNPQSFVDCRFGPVAQA